MENALKKCKVLLKDAKIFSCFHNISTKQTDPL